MAQISHRILWLVAILGGVSLSLLMGTFLVYVFAEGRGHDRQVVPLLWIPAMLPLLAAIQLHLRLLRRMWTSLGLACPQPSWGWTDQAHYGWVQRYQGYLLQQELDGPPVSARGARIFGWLLLISAVPVAGLPVAAFNLLFQGLFLSQAIRALRFLEASNHREVS